MTPVVKTPPPRVTEVVCRREARAVRGSGWAEEAYSESSCQSESRGAFRVLYSHREHFFGVARHCSGSGKGPC